ncbi:MAG: glutaredoxin domain-containing protein [Nocardioides sp.]
MGLADLLLGRPKDTPHAVAVANPEQGVTIYWRQGCPFCVRLRAAVRRNRDRATWVDIWSDPDAAAYVRSVNDGDETVPTVVIDGVPHTNPDPKLVQQALASR